MCKNICSFFFLQEKAKLHNEKIYAEIKDAFEKDLASEVDKSSLKFSDMNNVFGNLKQSTLQKVHHLHALLLYSIAKHCVFS